MSFQKNWSDSCVFVLGGSRILSFPPQNEWNCQSPPSNSCFGRLWLSSVGDQFCSRARGLQLLGRGFGAEFRVSLGRFGVEFGSVWGGVWVSLGRSLGQFGAEFGSVWGGVWVGLGRSLGQFGAEFGSVWGGVGGVQGSLGRSLVQFGAEFGRNLGQFGRILGCNSASACFILNKHLVKDTGTLPQSLQQSYLPIRSSCRDSATLTRR